MLVPHILQELAGRNGGLTVGISIGILFADIFREHVLLPVFPILALDRVLHHHLSIPKMGLSGKQIGLLVAVIVPALLSTLVVVARSLRKVKRRPSYISRTGALAAEVLLILSVVCLFAMTRMTSE